MSRAAHALAVIVALFSCATAFAQGGTAEIWGHVTAVTGEAVDEATITVTNVDTGVDRHARSDASGRFGFAALPPGRYQVTARHDGFAAQRQDDIVLVPAQRIQINLQLRQAPMPETIALNPYPPIAETARSHVSAPISETELHDLPIQDRQYLRLTGLAPHVAADALTGGVSVTNLPGSQNRLVIDGLDHTSSVTGEAVGLDGMARLPYGVSQAAIEGMRVFVSGAPAEIGGAAAGLFNVVTRSGANAFHGSAYEFFGDRALNGKTTLQEKAGLHKPAYRNNQFGGVMGGAITRKRNFFLVSYERMARTSGSPAAPDFNVVGPISEFTVSRLNTALAFPRDEQQDLFLARTDHAFGGQHLMLRFSDQRFEGAPLDVQTLQPAIASTTTATLRNRSGAASALAVFGSAFANEFRTQYADNRDEDMRPNAYNSFGPGAGLAQGFWHQQYFVGLVGSSRYGTHEFHTRRIQVANAISWVTGAHAVRIGGDLIDDRDVIGFGLQGAGFYQLGVVPSGARFEAGGPVRPTTIDSTRYAAFVQDAWRATSALTVDVGLRYDRQDMRPMLPNDDGHLAPRLGFAYSPGGRGKTLRGSYGVFDGSTPAVIPVLAHHGSSLLDPSFRQPRVHQASIGAEFEKYRAGSGGIQYVFARGEHLPRAVNVNVNRSVAPVVSFQSSAESVYNGISFNLRTRVLNQLFYRIAYTAGRSDETPQQPLAFVFGGINQRLVLAQNDRLYTRAPGNNDAHQRLEVAATWDTRLAALNRDGLAKLLLDNWMFAVLYTWQTGFPYSAFVVGDVNGDANYFNDVAPGTTWNQYRLPYRGSVDPRATRRFDIGGTRQLELIWEAFNVTNRPNYTAVDNTMYGLSLMAGVPALAANPVFGRKTAQSNGRMMQLAARFTF